MSYSLVKTVNFGSSRSGLSTVAWSLDGGANWSTVGVTEAIAGSGIYKAAITFADNFAGTLSWKTGEASGQRFAAEEINPGSSTDLGPVQAAVGQIQATLDGYAQLSPAAVITDPTPTTGGFTFALADGSPVPSTFVWRNSEAWFNGSGVLSGGKYPVATYTKLTTTTARITFSPLLPLAPADGDTLLLA